MNYVIEHQCPQCGAPAVLEESDRLFACGYCRVQSYLLGGDFFRYFFPHSVGEDKEVFFFPYWRFKGMVFSCTPEGITNRFIDVSHQACLSSSFPISVGLRSQALKLRFAVSGIKGRFFIPQLPFEQVMKNIEDQLNPGKAEVILHRSFIGDSLSMIYSPYYIDGKLNDGVLKKALPSSISLSEVNGFPSEGAKWTLRFIPALCPDCGWNLEGRKEALVLACRNCRSMWQTTSEDLVKIEFSCLGAPDEKAYYLPFWKIKATVSGLELNSYADLVQVANLPKVIRPGMHAIPFHFWVQAFKIRPQRFLHLAVGLTLSQPQGEMQSSLPEADQCHPVTLPVAQAVESLKTVLAGFAKPSQMIRSRLPEIKIETLGFNLVFIPFIDKIHEMVQPDFHISLNKNMLTLTTML